MTTFSVFYAFIIVTFQVILWVGSSIWIVLDSNKIPNHVWETRKESKLTWIAISVLLAWPFGLIFYLVLVRPELMKIVKAEEDEKIIAAATDRLRSENEYDYNATDSASEYWRHRENDDRFDEYGREIKEDNVVDENTESSDNDASDQYNGIDPNLVSTIEAVEKIQIENAEKTQAQFNQVPDTYRDVRTFRDVEQELSKNSEVSSIDETKHEDIVVDNSEVSTTAIPVETTSTKTMPIYASRPDSNPHVSKVAPYDFPYSSGKTDWPKMPVHPPKPSYQPHVPTQDEIDAYNDKTDDNK